MATKAMEVGATGVHRSFRLRTSSSDRIERTIAGGATWIAATTALVIAALPHPDNAYELMPVALWSLVYLVYTLCLHLLRWRKHAAYDHPLFREIRIHVNILMVSVLIWITGGPKSPFWPFYVLPILGAIIYSETSLRTIIVVAEVVVAYLVACLPLLGGSVSIDFSRLVMNSAALGFLALLLKYLTDLVRGHARSCLEAAQSIQDLASSLDPIADLGQLARDIVQRIVQATGAGDSTLMILNRDSGMLEMWAKYSRLEEEPDQDRFALGEGIAGRVAQTQLPKLVTDTISEEGFVSSSSQPRIGSLVSVPVLSQNRTIGVLNLDSPQPGFFTENDMWMLQAYAATVADKLVRAKVLQALQSLRENAPPDTTHTLHYILELLAQILPFDSATIFLLDGTRVTAEAVHRHPHPNLALNLTFDLEDDDLFSEMVQQRLAWLILSDAQQDSRFRSLGGAHYVRSWLAVSLTASGRVIGFLTLDSRQVGLYTEADAQSASVFGAHAAAAIQDARLLEDRQRRTDALQILHKATQAMVSRIRIDDIASDLVNHLGKLFDADVALLVARDEQKRELLFHRTAPDSEAQVGAPSMLEVARYIVAEVWRTRSSADYEDLAGQLEQQGQSHLLHESMVRSVLAVPVTYGDRMAGVLALISQHSGHFGRGERHLLEAMADSLAIALRNASLVTQLDSDRKALRALHQGSVEIASRLADQDLLRSIITRAAELVGAAGGAVYLLDEGKQSLSLAVCQGLDPVLEGARIEVGDSATWRAIRTCQPYLVNDYAAWESRLEIMEPYGLTSVVAVPMLWRDQPLGAIVVHDDAETRSYTKSEGDLLQAFASHAATVIAHSRTLADLSTKTQYLENLIKHALDGIIAIDAQGYITEFNGEAERLLHYTREEALGTPVTRMYAGGLEEARRIRTLLLEKGAITLHDTRVLTQEGAQVPIILSAVLLPDGGSVGFLEDLSAIENAHIETALLRAILESVATIGQGTTVDTAIEQLLHSLVDALAPQGVTGLELHRFDSERLDFLSPPSVVGMGSVPSAPSLEAMLHDALSRNTPNFVAESATNLPSTRDAGLEVTTTRGLAICPLRDGKEPVGVLLCYYDRPHDFSGAEQRLISTLAELAGIAVAKAQLYDQARGYAARLQTLNEIGALITDEPRLDKVFDLTVEHAREHFDADATSLMLWDEDRENLVIRAHRGLSEEYSRRQLISKERVEREIRQTAEDGVPRRVFVHNLRQTHFGQRDLIIKEDLCTVMIAPLYRGNELLGVLNVYSKRKPRRFSTVDLEMAQTYANQAAIAINNAWLYDEQSRAARELGLLAELASQLGIVQDEDMLVAIAAQLIGEHIRKPMRIGRIEGGQVSFPTAGAYGFRASTQQDGIQSVHDGIPGQAMEERRAVVVSSLRADPRCRYLPGGMNSQIAVPLLVGEEVMGVLEVFDERLGGVSEDDLRVLHPVASQLAVALKYAGVFRNHCAVQKLDMLSQLGSFLAHRMSNIVGTLPWQIDEITAALPADAPGVWEHVHGIKDDIAYLVNLAHELRRIPADDRATPSTVVDVNRWLEEALNNVRLDGIQLVRCLDETLPWVPAHPLLLKDVFLSLVQNAVSAMGSQGTLTLRTRQSSGGEWVYVEVEDTGHGMTDAEQARLFAPYFSQRRGGKGTGMGLALWVTKLLLQSWGGDIKVLRTEPGEGTTFSVRLPSPQTLTKPDAELAAQYPPAPSAPTPGKLAGAPGIRAGGTVLVVDDADNWRSTLIRLLEGRGHTVYAAASYEEALVLLRRHPIDVAVLDIRLIDSDELNQDGLRLARQVVALYPRAATILLTGFDVPAQVAKMKAEGIVFEVLRKKQDKAEFDAAFFTALARSSASPTCD